MPQHKSVITDKKRMSQYSLKLLHYAMKPVVGWSSVLVGSHCQLATAENHLISELVLSNSLYQIGLWACLWWVRGIVLDVGSYSSW